MESQETVNELSDYQKVRRLLLGENSTQKIDQLSQNDINYISNLISEAIIARNHKDNSLGDALAPIIDRAFDQSITRDPRKIADVFFPIIGPAIRKSVSTALFDMVQSLNLLLEKSLSFEALQWRYRAWRTGKNYAEYVLIKTLKYRVEQVFLIHKETGILINSAVADEVSRQDPDLVSSMLTAINDFAGDSFNTKEQSLEWLKFGDLILHIAIGPKAVMAVAVRGTLSSEVTETVSHTLERIHDSYYALLENFDGDRDKWKFVSPLVESCLLYKTQKVGKKRRPWLAIVLILTSFSYIAYQQLKMFQFSESKEAIVKQIENNKDYTIVEKSTADQTLHITVLKEPESISIEDYLKQKKLMKIPVKVKELAVSVKLNKQLLDYIHSVINSPMTLIFSQQNGILNLSGSATQRQLNSITNDKLLNQYYTKINFDQVNITEVQIEKANNEAILKQRFTQLYETSNGKWFSFEKGKSNLSIKEIERFSNLIADLKELYILAEEVNNPIKQITLIGFADNSGSSSNNQLLSLQRARAIKDILVENELPARDILVIGAGQVDNSQLPEEHQRRVNLMIFYAAGDKTMDERYDN